MQKDRGRTTAGSRRIALSIVDLGEPCSISMKTACTTLLVATLAAFGRPLGPEAVTAGDPGGLDVVPTSIEGAGAGFAGVPLDTPRVTLSADSASGSLRSDESDLQSGPDIVEDDETESRRDRRWSRRNRYPGPIPTPADWVPPEGPVRIALQAGHWRADEAPDELSGLRGAGAYAHGQAEWEINLDIAQRAAALLEELGYEVDILPAVVPPGYRAHLFLAIHADGNNDPRASGYRVAYPRRDATGRAPAIAELLAMAYGEATGLKQLPDVTRRMRNYYAFNFRRYEHALHPMTIAVILETGFLTSPVDRKVIVSDPDRAAKGIVAAVTAFPITPPPLTAVTAETGPE
jgi:N-acetylmuramoyl-L-alanine amidase